MSEHTRFHLRNLDLLREELALLGLTLPIDEDLSCLADKVWIGDRQTANRFASQPMEGFDSLGNGGPSELSVRRYTRYASGRFAFLWFEATAVLREARSNPKQLWLHGGSVDDFARLVDAARNAAREKFGHEITMAVQLTHSGRYSKPGGTARPIIAHHSEVLDPRHNLPADYPLATDEYLDRLQDTYVEAARLAAKAGFDGVDVKSCHRYLVSELLASHTREGKYGGSFENRTRFLREVTARIRQEVPEVFVTTRMNVYDAIPYPYGFGVSKDDYREPDLSEPIELIRELRQYDMPLVNVSIGNPYYNPHYGRPFDRSVAGAGAPPEHPLEGVARFVNITRQIQQAVPDLPVVGGGYGWLRHLMPYVAAGVVRRGWATLIGQGRGAFAYPDSVNDLLTVGAMDPEKTCVTCSGCTQIMRDGTMTGCVVRDQAIYSVQYKLGRRFAMDHLRAEAKRCRDCEFATCTSNCPAHVDVPSFVRAFADGDIAKAYDVLRASNVLPEMCAYICPAEVQCEGGCLEQIFDKCALPIRDIQLVVSRVAREEGLAGVRLPEAASGKRVAVVGGGPAGLACAVRLLEKGHSVEIVERNEHLGGTPQWIIPGGRYEDGSAEIEAVLAPGVQAGRLSLRLGCTFGQDVGLDELRAKFDAVFLALGLGQSTSLGQAPGVVDALKFLGDVKSGKITRLHGKVAVLGAGNTAMDAAVTAKELGAQDVFIIYRRSFNEMPAWPSERDHLLKAGGHVLILTQPVGYETDRDGKLAGLRIARTELGEPDDSGRRRPIVIPGSESVMAVDMVVEAMGQGIPAKLQEALGSVTLTRHGLIATDPGSQATTTPGVFAGGDLVNGGTTAVKGISEGMRAADEIDELLAQAAV
jgi:NADPH-dependent glutamate synthase beta subunit-like oxidoreductase/2,4-dienoyl-CoA reductase-like NADH-dependent reductase (Old Yellow Enzyme family)